MVDCAAVWRAVQWSITVRDHEWANEEDDGGGGLAAEAVDDPPNLGEHISLHTTQLPSRTHGTRGAEERTLGDRCG